MVLFPSNFLVALILWPIVCRGSVGSDAVKVGVRRIGAIGRTWQKQVVVALNAIAYAQF